MSKKPKFTGRQPETLPDYFFELIPNFSSVFVFRDVIIHFRQER
jgi:hypothetical protein